MNFSKQRTFYPEIEGMRALAVLMVIFFHIGWRAYRGGFIGVDIFFVISGFLMTRVIVQEISVTRQFNFVAYFARRLRRLLPALCATSLLTLLAGFFILSPSHFFDLCSSAIASILSFANIYYWSESGYFDINSSFKPLLHTWSLSLEEQFYLIWPLILLLAFRLNKKNTVWTIYAVSLLSFVFSSYPNILTSLLSPLLDVFFKIHPSPQISSFYWVPFRIFEFGIGAILAFHENLKLKTQTTATLTGITGLFLVLYTSNIYSHETPFPSYRALFPCLGAALIIISGNSRIVQILLSNNLMRHIGRISYSLYLTHWPIIVLGGYKQFGEFSIAEQILMFFSSLILAELLYFLIEKPFRTGRFSFKHLAPKSYLTVAATMVSTVILFSIIGKLIFNSTKTEGELLLQSAINIEKKIKNKSKNHCQLGTKGILFCDSSKKQNFLIIGDSHAPIAFYGFEPHLTKKTKQPMLLSYRGCNFRFDNSRLSIDSKSESHCQKTLQAINLNKSTLASVEKILLASYRPFSYEPQNIARFDLIRFLLHLNPSLKIFILGNYFQTAENKPCEAIMSVFDKPAKECLNPKHVKYYGSTKAIKSQRFFNRLDSSKYIYIDVVNLVCPNIKNCPSEVNGIPFMFDFNHLTFSFSKTLYSQMLEKNYQYFIDIGFLEKK